MDREILIEYHLKFYDDDQVIQNRRRRKQTERKEKHYALESELIEKRTEFKKRRISMTQKRQNVIKTK